MLLKQPVSVQACNTLVVLRIAGEKFAFAFEDALYLSAETRWNARLAKLSTGNSGRGFFCRGVLTDGAPTPKRKRGLIRIPELLLARAIRVGTEGQLVTMTIKGTTAKFPYPAARELSQWLRIRGKEAKHNAGELAHWSKFVG